MKTHAACLRTINRQTVVVVGLLLLQFLLGLHTIFANSVTHDEIWHLPAGLRTLEEWRFDIEHLNPPVTRVWAALPVWIAGVETDTDLTGVGIGRAFVENHPKTFQRDFRWGRAFNLLWLPATGLVLFFWTNMIFGARAALLALVCFVASPNVLAHASLVTPDVGLMFAFVATLFLAERWSRAPCWSRALAAGAMLGLALAMKFTAVLLYPLCLLALLVSRHAEGARSPSLSQRILQPCAGFVMSLLVLWLCFGFQGLFRPLKSYAFQSAELQWLASIDVLKGLPVPLPRDWLLGFDEQRAIMQLPHPVFLDGEWSTQIQGFRSYYIKTLLYKLPHLLQFLIAVGSLAAVVLFCQGKRRNELTLLIAAILALLGIASWSGMQLGIRYILPILPLLMILAGGSILFFEKWPRAQRGVLAILMVGSLFSLRHHPHHLSYFNELSGGPIGGRHHLLDSNLDWGQDLGALAEIWPEIEADSSGLAYYGTVPPGVLGIEYELPPSWIPKPGVYAVSVNYVMGRPHVITQGDGSSRSTNFQEWGYFQSFRPVKTLGGSIDIYDISEADVDAWWADHPQINPALRNR